MRRGQPHAKQFRTANRANAIGHGRATAGEPRLGLSNFSFFFTFKTIGFQDDSLDRYGSKIARLSYHIHVFVKGLVEVGARHAVPSLAARCALLLARRARLLGRFARLENPM